MPLIQPAKLVICPKCKAHAHIVASDGTESMEFLTKTQGMWRIRTLFYSGKIVEEEGNALAKALHESDLPESDMHLALLTLVKGGQGEHLAGVRIDPIFENELFEDVPLTSTIH